MTVLKIAHAAEAVAVRAQRDGSRAAASMEASEFYAVKERDMVRYRGARAGRCSAVSRQAQERRVRALSRLARAGASSVVLSRSGARSGASKRTPASVDYHASASAVPIHQIPLKNINMNRPREQLVPVFAPICAPKWKADMDTI